MQNILERKLGRHLKTETRAIIGVYSEVNTEEGICISIYHYHNAGCGYYYRKNSFSFFSQKSFKYLVQIRSMSCLWGICGGKWH